MTGVQTCALPICIYGNGIAADGSGNSYVTGHFNFASVSFGPDTLTSVGSSCIFIVKFDSTGNFKWAKGVGSYGSEQGNSITVDGNKNCYLTGFYQDNSITFGTTTLTGAGANDMFIAKLAGTVSSVPEVQDGASVIVYPNPASNQLTISNLKWIQNIEVYNMLGQCVISQIASPKSEQQLINVSTLPSGIYFLKVNCADKIYSQKIIVE